jgi:hypothetical protein
MNEPAGESLDVIAGEDGEIHQCNASPAASTEPDNQSLADPPAGPIRPWIGVRFTCCGLYARVYRRPNETRYVVRCPSCGQRAIVRVDPSGTPHRFFRAGPH